VFVFETEGHDPFPEISGWRLARDKTYGATRVLIWVRELQNSRPTGASGLHSDPNGAGTPSCLVPDAVWP
jgi:hypothetical protein